MTARALPFVALAGAAVAAALAPFLTAPGVALLFGIAGAATLVGTAKTLAGRGLQREEDDG